MPPNARQQRSVMKLDLVDHSDSEVALHRIYYFLKSLRGGILNLILTGVVLASYLLFGLKGIDPLFDTTVEGTSAIAANSPPGFVTVVGGLSAAIVALLFWWSYTSIIGTSKTALRVQSVLWIGSVLAFPVLMWPGFSFAATRLHPAIFALDVLFTIFASFFLIDVAVTSWRISTLRENASLVATLDGRLTRGVWSYINKLLDLPRTPFRTFRSALSYVLAFIAAVIFIKSAGYIMGGGGALTKVNNLLFSCGIDDNGNCYRESGRFTAFAAIGLVVAFGGLRVSSLLQSAARYLGSLSLPEALPDRSRPFALYLRPFDTDAVTLPKPRMPFITKLLTFRPFPARIEEELFDVTDGYLPLVAIGRPGANKETRADLAHRVFLSEGEWRPYVLDLIRRSAVIVIVLRYTDGVVWELESLIQEGAARKTFFCFHPTAHDRGKWEEIAGRILPLLRDRGLLPQKFELEGHPLAFAIGKKSVRGYCNRHWTTTSYRTAFSTFLSEHWSIP
jgi:hypothetical protein